MSADGSTLLNGTFLGGSTDEYPREIIFTNNSIYITGYTDSTDFPTSIGAYGKNLSGSDDVFIANLDSNLSTLLGGTYLGGASADEGFSVAIDSKGYICITGETGSDPFNTTSNAYSASYYGGTRDVFLSRLSPDMTELDYSTYFGTAGGNYGTSIAIDNTDALYITGFSYGGLPTTPGAFNETSNGYFDLFISKFSIPYWTDPSGESNGGNDGSLTNGIPAYPLEFIVLISVVTGLLLFKKKKFIK